MRKKQSGQRHRAKPTTTRRAVSAEEREAIIVASIEGQSQPQIAEAFGRSPHTIRAILRSEAGQKRKAEYLREIANAARTRLRRAAVRAADSWVRQIELVDEGQRGNHLPAKDLLTHTGVIDVAAPKKGTGDHIVIQMGGGPDDEIVPIRVPKSHPASTPRQITIGPDEDDPTS